MIEKLQLEDHETIQISPTGEVYVLSQLVNDQNFLKQFYKNLQAKDHYFISKANDKEFLVEAYNQVLVINDLIEKEGRLYFAPVEDHQLEINLNELYLDDWDRFLTRTAESLPAVFSERGQNQLFDLCDFDDYSITYKGKRYETPYYYHKNSGVKEASWWDAKYRGNNKPSWELDSHHPYLEVALPTLKLPKSKVLVLGCGAGHDAAFFAKAGHIVDAIDFSEEAITKAKELYGSVENMEWINQDLFTFDNFSSYDIVFDHTNYCAVSPEKRGELIKRWSQFLRHGGHLLGVFFAMDKQNGPPFGGSEWELNKRIEKYFLPVYWNRIRNAPNYSRFGIEFMAYLAKR